VTFTVERLSPELTFGRVLTGLTHDDLKNEAVREKLRHYWVVDGLVIFRGAEVTPDFQVDLSEVFSNIEVHPVTEIHHPENKKLIRLVSNPRGEDEDLIEVDGVPGCAWLPWHKDLVFTDRLNHGGILRATQITSSGGETGYIDQIAAYERLPDEIKAKIDDLEVVYQYGPIETSPWCARETVRYVKVGPANRSMNARAARDWPPVVHPLVFVQRETRRKALNLSPRFAQAILGWDKPDSDALLTMLANHLWDSPAYFHKWQLDEMVLWDNWRMLHCVTPGPYEEVRIVERTTLGGDYGLGRKLESSSAAA
jgi:taurine dioxygenase